MNWSNDRNQIDCYISVIVAVKNGAQTIQKCIDSYANQTHIRKELIIIDGESTDGTVDIIKANSEIVSYTISKADNGIAQAWNRAISQARGDWVIFLGADDFFYNSAVLEQFIKEIQSNNKIVSRIIYGKISMVLESGEVLYTEGNEWTTIKQLFLTEKMAIPHPACFHHKSVFNDFGKFDEDFKIALDYEFLLRVLINEDAYFIPSITITNMGHGGLSSQISNLHLMLDETDNALKKHSIKPQGFKRVVNKSVYKLANVLVRVGGEYIAKIFLDLIRKLSGKPSIWTRK